MNDLTNVRQSVDVDRLLYYANSEQAFFSVLSHLTWKRAVNGYRCRESSGLSLLRKGGKWIIKNHSEKLDVANGDIWSVTKALFNLDTNTQDGFLQCCKIIADASGQVLDLLQTSDVTTLPKFEVKPVANLPFVPNEKNELARTYKAEFTGYSSEIGRAVTAYWQKWGVTLDTLKRYTVRPLNSVTYLSGSYATCFSLTDIAFSYIPKGLKHTIKYKRPFADKDSRERYVQNTGNYVFGWEQLPEPDKCKGLTLIICAGEKDCLVLNQHLNTYGFYAICFYSETAPLDSNFIKQLRSRFKAVFTLFDNDATGKKHMEKNREEHGLSCIDIATHTAVNDVADIVEAEGAERLKQIVLFETTVSKTGNRTTIQARQGKKLSEILPGVNILNKRLIAPTGSGKTYFIAHSPGHKILVCPTIALVKNACNSYGGYEFRRKQRQIDFISNAGTLAGLPSFIVTTYASFHKLAECLGGLAKDIPVFIDEAHNFSASTSRVFQLRQLTEVLETVKQFRSVTTMTGTEVFNAHPFLNSLPVVEVKQEKPVKECTFVNAEDTLKTAAELTRQSITAGRFPIVLFENTKEDGRLGTLQSYINDRTVKSFNSHTKEDSDFKSITKNGLIRPGVRGIVTTSVLKEGNNIYGERCFDIIVLGNFHSAHIDQLANRPREAKEIKIHVVRSGKRQASDKDFNPEQFGHYYERRCTISLQEMNVPGECDSDTLAKECFVRQSIQQLPIKLNEETSLYEIDHLLLSNIVFENQKNAENRNDGLMARNLAKYGIQVMITAADTTIASEAEQQAARELRATGREKLEQEYRGHLKELAVHPDAETYIEHQLASNRNRLTKGQKKAYERFEKLSEVMADKKEILEKLEETGLSDAKFSLLLKRFAVWELRTDEKYMNGNRKLPIVLKAIYSRFNDGETITSEEIKERLKSILGLDKSFDPEFLEQDGRNDKALKLLRLFFEATKTKVGNGEDKEWKYRITPLTFSNNSSKIRGVKKLRRELEFTEFGYPATWDI